MLLYGRLDRTTELVSIWCYIGINMNDVKKSRITVAVVLVLFVALWVFVIYGLLLGNV